MHFHATRPELCEVKPLHRNRRECVRYPAQGTAIAIAELGERRIVSNVRLIDASPAGLGLSSPMELPHGAHVRLHFNGSDLPGRSGTIVRCTRTDEGYSVGVFCDASVACA